MQSNAQVWLVVQMNMPSCGWLQAARNWGYDLYSKVSYQVSSHAVLYHHDGLLSKPVLMHDADHLMHDDGQLTGVRSRA